MMSKVSEEYNFLTDRLYEVEDSLRGSCDDIDCDKYIYKDLLKKRYAPVLKHNYSCISHAKRDRDLILRILSLKRYVKSRYLKCPVCKKKLDKIDKKSTLVVMSRPSLVKNCSIKGNFSELNFVDAHTRCKNKVKIPEGWKRIWANN